MNINDLDIKELFEAIANDDRNAFARLHQSSFHTLKQYAFVILKSEELAEEATSDVFMKLWTGRTNLPTVQHPKTYIFKALKNICLNKIRKDKSNLPRTVELESNDLAVSFFDSPADIMENKELFKLLDAMVEALPAQRKIIFRLVKDQGLKHKDVAELLNISTRTVENQLYKAVKQLAQLIEVYLGTNPTQKKRNSRLLFLFI